MEKYVWNVLRNELEDQSVKLRGEAQSECEGKTEW